MKVVKIKNMIVSLENVKSVTQTISGSGAKSNPYNYAINIQYFGNEGEYIHLDEDRVAAETAMAQIFQILEN